MKMTNIIAKTKDKAALNHEEIRFFIKGMQNGEIPDYQVSAWLMAAYIQGLTESELVHLTKEMAESGTMITLDNHLRPIVDKHSTGGVGDKITLIVAPILAALGCSIAKLSGRSLSFAGGTIDKLESIPGFMTEVSVDQFKKQLKEIGIVVASQTDEMTPADKKLYHLRDITETVNSLPLIASSIMSKKLSVDSDVIVLDVKAGEGAFCKSVEEAVQLAAIMVNIGVKSNRKTEAIVSSMDQPLGHAVGNSLEIIEALHALSGQGPKDVMELVHFLITRALLLSGMTDTADQAKRMINEVIESGAALQKFKDLIIHQGGDGTIVEEQHRLPVAPYRTDILASESGAIQHITPSHIGVATMRLGAGRERKEDVIDHGVGIMVRKKVGDFVEQGEVLATVYSNLPSLSDEITDLVTKAFIVGPEPDARHHDRIILAHISHDGETIKTTVYV